ncbi:hypothetical protein TSUD_322720 [Trifolium subterraneum]|uniref:Uncharacterized protein n=1 Tax=Trifolium subterraneum TaxID=3900 RepID=A0A2Z6LXR4_TRISU|nr:hypothetical protein TSUD_322720 [Trifolium subterraneum]
MAPNFWVMPGFLFIRGGGDRSVVAMFVLLVLLLLFCWRCFAGSGDGSPGELFCFSLSPFIELL